MCYSFACLASQFFFFFFFFVLTLSKNNGSVVLARRLLTQLTSLYEETKDPRLLPSAFPYNYVLNCAANSLENKTVAFQCATETFQEMRQSDIVAPDSFTYSFWLKCCANLLSPSELQTKCVKYAMEECKKNGFVSSEVLTRLIRGNSPQVVDEVLELDPETSPRTIRVQDLQPSWSRNCRWQTEICQSALMGRTNTRWIQRWELCVLCDQCATGLRTEWSGITYPSL